MIDGTEKPKSPSKVAKRAARYNEVDSNKMKLRYGRTLMGFWVRGLSLENCISFEFEVLSKSACNASICQISNNNRTKRRH